MEIYYNSETYPSASVRSDMERIASMCTEECGLDSSQVSLSVSFVDAEEIRDLNAQFRSVDAATDVLSFPQWDGSKNFAMQSMVELGDVVLCKEIIDRQALEYGHSEQRELLYLFTHGVLHLLGFDHIEENDKIAMRKREDSVMERLGLDRSYEGETMDYKQLYRMALQAVDKAYAPYSGFRVGAALLTESGEVYTGVNVENSSFGATICAERTAFVKAVSEGHKQFRAIAIASSGGQAWPCGICRQFMYEFADSLDIITGADEDHLDVRDIKELLPEGFRL